MINTLEAEKLPDLNQMQLNTLTLERNAVLIARVSRNSGYGIDELETFRKHLKDMFPYHRVFVWYDDIDFMAIHDKGYAPERMSVINDTSNYY